MRLQIPYGGAVYRAGHQVPNRSAISYRDTALWSCLRGGIGASVWHSNTTYTFGDYVLPSVDMGHAFVCTAVGISGSTEPTWPTSGTVADNSVQWTECGSSAKFSPLITLPPPTVSLPYYMLQTGELGVVTSSGHVTAWNDQSGNARNLTTTSTAITSNIADTHLFDHGGIILPGNSDGVSELIFTSANLTQPTSFHTVVSLDSIVNGGFIFDGTTNRNAVFVDGTALAYFAGTVVDSSYTPTANKAFSIQAVFNGASSALYVNGAQVASGNPGTASIDDITLGAHVNQPLRCGEFWVFHGALTAVDIAALAADAVAKYRLT